MSAITDTARGTENVISERIAINMSETISQLQPSASPLLVLTKKMGTMKSTNYKFEWMEDDLMVRDVVLEAATDVATTIVVATGEGALVAVNDLIKVVRTGEVVKVTAIAGDSLTVIRSYGETANAAINLDDKAMVVANANMQGAGAPGEKYTNPVPNYNYTQIFRTPFSITNTLDKTKMIGGQELASLRRKAGIEHAKSIELALILGERNLDTSGAQPITTTRGVLKFLATSPANATYTAAAVTEVNWLDFLQEVFRYGSSTKPMFTSPTLLGKINSWAQGKLEIMQSSADGTYGLNITKYISPFGTIMFINHPLLVDSYDGYGIVLDMEEVKYRALMERDTKLKTNIQNNDEDGKRDEYLTEAGLELRQPKKHGLFIITD